MVPFDIFLAVVVGFSLIYSLFKGMVREIFSLLSLIAGYVVAVRYQGMGADWLEQFIGNDTVARLASFALLFIVTAAVVSILGGYARKLIRTSEVLSGWDRLGGGVFGVVKGVFFMVLLMFPLQLYPDVDSKLTRASIFAPHLRSLSNDLIDNLDAQGGFMQNIKMKTKELEKLKIIRDLSKKYKKNVKKAQDEHTASDRQELNDILDSIRNEDQE